MKRQKRVAGLIRVSSERQAESQLSLDAQRQQIVSYCVASQYEIIDIYGDEGISGSLGEDEREGLSAALKAITEGRADTLMVCKRDRLARSVDLCGWIVTTVERAGGQVLILDELDAPPILKIVMLMVSEIERELSRQRTRIAMRELRARGIHVGRTPFGFVVGDDGKLMRKPGEIEIVLEVVALRAQGSTLAQIAASLTDRSIPTRRGGRWSAEQVRSMLMQAEKQNVQRSSATAA